MESDREQRKRDRSDLRTELDALADEVMAFMHSLSPSKASAGVSAPFTQESLGNSQMETYRLFIGLFLLYPILKDHDNRVPE